MLCWTVALLPAWWLLLRSSCQLIYRSLTEAWGPCSISALSVWKLFRLRADNYITIYCNHTCSIWTLFIPSPSFLRTVRIWNISMCTHDPYERNRQCTILLSKAYALLSVYSLDRNWAWIMWWAHISVEVKALLLTTVKTETFGM